MKPYLSVIIPAYNEAKRLPLTLIDIDKHLSRADFSYEIIVVSDGSKDGTAEIVNRFKHLVKNLSFIDNKENHGKGWVVRQGMLEAKGNVRLFMDSDNATSVDQFSKMMPYFKEGYDVVIGSRDVKGAVMIPPEVWYRQIAGNIGNIVIQILLLPGMWDTQCGFKAFTEEAVHKIFPKMKIDRWAFDVEALSLAKKMGLKTREIPVTWVDHPGSTVSLKTYFIFFREVFKIKWWFITNQYDLKNKNKEIKI